MRDGNNVDYSQRTAPDPDEDDPMADPLMRALRDLTKYDPMWRDPVQVKGFYDSLQDAMSTGPDKAKGASPGEVSRLRQESPDDLEYMDGEEGARKWRETKRL